MRTPRVPLARRLEAPPASARSLIPHRRAEQAFAELFNRHQVATQFILLASQAWRYKVPFDHVLHHSVGQPNVVDLDVMHQVAVPAPSIVAAEHEGRRRKPAPEQAVRWATRRRIRRSRPQVREYSWQILRLPGGTDPIYEAWQVLYGRVSLLPRPEARSWPHIEVHHPLRPFPLPPSLRTGSPEVPLTQVLSQRQSRSSAPTSEPQSVCRAPGRQARSTLSAPPKCRQAMPFPVPQGG